MNRPDHEHPASDETVENVFGETPIGLDYFSTSADVEEALTIVNARRVFVTSDPAKIAGADIVYRIARCGLNGEDEQNGHHDHGNRALAQSPIYFAIWLPHPNARASQR